MKRNIFFLIIIFSCVITFKYLHSVNILNPKQFSQYFISRNNSNPKEIQTSLALIDESKRQHVLKCINFSETEQHADNDVNITFQVAKSFYLPRIELFSGTFPINDGDRAQIHLLESIIYNRSLFSNQAEKTKCEYVIDVGANYGDTGKESFQINLC
jgi:hypothetical protein